MIFREYIQVIEDELGYDARYIVRCFIAKEHPLLNDAADSVDDKNIKIFEFNTRQIRRSSSIRLKQRHVRARPFAENDFQDSVKGRSRISIVMKNWNASMSVGHFCPFIGSDV